MLNTRFPQFLHPYFFHCSRRKHVWISGLQKFSKDSWSIKVNVADCSKGNFMDTRVTVKTSEVVVSSLGHIFTYGWISRHFKLNFYAKLSVLPPWLPHSWSFQLSIKRRLSKQWSCSSQNWGTLLNAVNVCSEVAWNFNHRQIVSRAGNEMW